MLVSKTTAGHRKTVGLVNAGIHLLRDTNSSNKGPCVIFTTGDRHVYIYSNSVCGRL